MRNQYEKFYSVTDDKFKKDEFNEKKNDWSLKSFQSNANLN